MKDYELLNEIYEPEEDDIDFWAEYDANKEFDLFRMEQQC